MRQGRKRFRIDAGAARSPKGATGFTGTGLGIDPKVYALKRDMIDALTPRPPVRSFKDMSEDERAKLRALYEVKP